MPGQGHAEAVEALAEAAQTIGKQEQGAVLPVAPTHHHAPPPACTASMHGAYSELLASNSQATDKASEAVTVL